MATLVLEGVVKEYAGRVPALRGVTLEIADGEFVALMGPSGCGKSTLLHLLGGMDRCSGGRLRWGDEDLTQFDERRLIRYRRDQVGFVFQFFNLLPTLTAAENVALPALLAGKSPAAAQARAGSLLAEVGLAGRTRHLPSTLSGGEQQRAAIARALVNQPKLLLADEPTGSLDSANGRKIIELLQQLHRTMRMTIVLATHDAEIAAAAERTIYLRDGLLGSSETVAPQATTA